MSEPFVGEIRMFAGNFAPRGWAFCDGQLLMISQNDALFSLFGTFYGGNGRTTFGLPDMRGRLPVHAGSGPGLSRRTLGSKSGSEQVAIGTNQLPSHNHGPVLVTVADGDTADPQNNLPSRTDNLNIYSTAVPDATMATSSFTSTGGSQAHTNIMPYLCVNFIVALFGVFPSPS